MKAVQFSLGGSSVAKPSGNKRVHEEDDVVKQERITEFSIGDAAAPAKKERKVIACKPNRVPSKMQAEPDAIGKLEDKFEASVQAQTVGTGTYGLVSRQDEEREEHTRVASETEVLKQQTDNLPDEPDGQAYEDMPVEDFGLALLRGMGMTKEHVVPTVDFVARPSRMGLGAKPGEIVKHGKKQNYKQLVGIDGSIKSVVRKGEKVIDVSTLGPKVGKRMTVAGGRHAGLECEVKSLNVNGEADAVRVRLFPSERDVTVRASDLSEPGAPARPGSRAPRDPAHPRHETSSPKPQREDHRRDDPNGTRSADKSRYGEDADSRKHSRPHKGGRDDHYGDRSNGAASKSHRRDGDGRSAVNDRVKDTERYGEKSRQRSRRKSWLREGARVRVVSKHVGRGKVYLSKAWVTAVVGLGECYIVLDDGAVVEGVREEDLETVVSKKAGTRVIVVMGEHAGEHGKVFEKHKQSVMVQLSESREVVELDLDSVADYHGSEHDDDW